ncbi:GNAT family N-acetyltransferase [Halomicrobium sp. IBSBa]|uniref:GNAT family N-acetyltransferase n=1 Tax=Halomicrobium sp. IBSBa TaxID=2778916 RepID=UPI001ABEF846|nr:GNAT family N-acetyltransferase [Halomicrobium sp. IBSBa]MBO4247951.1 GNAT family N-acetyltransferase [Halomicrobium sp. IBSBa]
MRVREATPADRAAVANVLDGAALETEPARLKASLQRGETLLAVADDGERVLGALVLDGDRIVSVAVRRRRRGQGIGSALVERALAERGRLVAAFDERVRPFYETLGFAIEPVDGDESRYRGRLEDE